MEATPQDNRPRIKRILKSYQESAITMNGPSKRVGQEGPVREYYFETATDSRMQWDPIESGPPRNAVRSAEKRSHGDEVDTCASWVKLGRTENQSEARFATSTGMPVSTPNSVSAEEGYSFNAHRSPVSNTGIIPMPLERFESELIMTTLEGKDIAGFEIGGEPRLCLPTIITSVLAKFTQEEILAVCKELNFYLATCTSIQLEELKRISCIPVHTTQCGLITKTDAERMCNMLLHVSDKHLIPAIESFARNGLQNQIEVFHECFGGCYGLLAVDEYTTADSPCICCRECGIAFSTEQFVSHCHKDPERRACHWGFDPKRWRSYLMVASSWLDHREKNRFDSMLSNVMRKFASNPDCLSVSEIEFYSYLLMPCYHY